jgi:hypothetical protein
VEGGTAAASQNTGIASGMVAGIKLLVVMVLLRVLKAAIKTGY